jgi:hypothetical protein
MTDERPSSETEFDARNEIDYLLAGLPRKLVSIVTLYQAVVRCEVDLVVRRTEEAGGDRREGLVLTDPSYGRLAALFTETGLAARWVEKLAPAPHEVLTRLGGEVLAILAPDVGLWLNPEGRRGCRIASVALRRLREDFGIHLPEARTSPTASPGSIVSTLPPGNA